MPFIYYFSGGSMPVAKVPERSDAEVQSAAAEERARRAKARGRQSTILGGKYTSDTNEMGSKTVLGG